MKATTIAPANIAFIKYWGKRDERLRLPTNSSVSMNLSAATTTTTVEFSDSYQEDDIQFVDDEATQRETTRIVAHLDRIRKRAKSSLRARVVTQNSFPKSSGIASSASGFAALTVAAAGALGLTLAEKELTTLARLGSGSACRSIPDGFVEWLAGKTNDASHAYCLYPHTHWDLRDIVAIVDTEKKKVASTEGMDGVITSPLFQTRLAAIPGRIARVKAALQKKDIALLGAVLEEECLDMHRVCQTQIPPLYYWNDVTRDIIRAVGEWRKGGLAVYFTIDAGPNVHLICEAKDEQVVVEKVKTLSGIEQVIINKPAQGAHLI